MIQLPSNVVRFWVQRKHQVTKRNKHHNCYLFIPFCGGQTKRDHGCGLFQAVATADWLGDVLTHIDGGPTERLGAGCGWAGRWEFCWRFSGRLKEKFDFNGCNYMIYRCTCLHCFTVVIRTVIHKLHQIIYSNQTKDEKPSSVDHSLLVNIYLLQEAFAHGYSRPVSPCHGRTS